MPCPARHQHGFTYLGLIILVAILGLVGAAGLKMGSLLQRQAAEQELLDIGAQFSDALYSYAAATPPGQPQQPPTLAALLRDQGSDLPTGHQAALMQDHQPIVGLYFVEQVGGPQHADALFDAQAAHVLVQRQAAGRVEADAGFIQQQQARLMQQRPGDFHPAPVSAVELADFFAAPFREDLACQFGGYAQVGLAPR